MLRDTTIRNMTFTQFDDVARPKVLGSLYLDRLFSGNQQPALDLFILLSSVTYITRSPGQASYRAANAFLVALAAARRRRSLAGVALNVGPILGVGYMQRSTSTALDRQVLRTGTRQLSEADFHQLLAEVVVAGRPGRSRSDGEDCVSEITTSLRDVAYDTTERPA